MAWNKIALVVLHLFRNKDKIKGDPADFRTVEASRRRFRRSIVILVFAVLYWLSPIDLIPGLPPFEWIEDIPLLIAACLYSGYAHRQLIKARARAAVPADALLADQSHNDAPERK